MITEAYNTDSLRKIIRSLECENKILKEKLRSAGIPFSSSNPFEDKAEEQKDFDPDQGGRIILPDYISDDMAKRFFAVFWGRQDVYAKRGKNGGYYPQCRNRWNDKLCPKYRGGKAFCDGCINREWIPLELWKIKEHLKGTKTDGSDVIGVYPLFPNGTCRFIVFDFDYHGKGAETSDFANPDYEWHDEVDALRKICVQNGIKPLVERSRSGRGAHVWIFFKHPITAVIARKFGFLLLEKGAASINLRSFHYYDRMYPAQDISDGIGNLIALPMQGQALKNGNSAFIDENWNAYPDQWDLLRNHISKLEITDVKECILRWQKYLGSGEGTSTFESTEKLKPWRRKYAISKEDVNGRMHLVLSNGIYIDALNLTPRIQNQIRSMAAFDNPEYYKNKRMGYSNYYRFSSIYFGKDMDGYIRLPRGLRESIIKECDKAGILYEISDQREKGRPIRVSFKGTLRMQQDLAAQDLLAYSDGVLSATPAFGKTVVCSYLIAQRKVNTLILLQSKELLTQWVDELHHFLDIQEELPEYTTKTGRKKIRKDIIGILSGNKNTRTGIVDVAMVQSLSGKEDRDQWLHSYGMVIMDECHHAAAKSSVELLQETDAKYVYGVSATPKRGDSLDKIIFFMLGPLRHKYTTMERAEEQGIGHYVISRYTRMVDTSESKENIGKAYELLAQNASRNHMIVEDVRACVQEGRTPLILTRTKEHARNLATQLKGAADSVFILYGDNTDKENAEIRRCLANNTQNKSLILVATGQKIGEGFDFPRLDTLMLAAPVSYEGKLEQYIGRLNRDYEGKTEVIVYDYVDFHMKFFDRMYNKRLKNI